MPTKVLSRLLFGGASRLSWPAEIGLLVLRAWTGLALAFGHGISKIPPDQGLIDSTDALGFPLPTVSAWMAALGEFAGGILLALGLVTRPAALWIMCVMGTAAFMVHWNDPLFTSGGPAKEMALLFFAPAFCLLMTGSGRTGIDQFIRGKSAPRD